MDRIDGETVVFRRSTRQSRNKVVFEIDLKPREGLKRKRAAAAVTETETEENNTDTGSPDKISKLQLAGDAGDGPENGDQNNTVEMDVEEHVDQNQDMSSEEESENSEADMTTKPLIQEDSVVRTLHVGNLETEEMKAFLRQQRYTHKKSRVPELPRGGVVYRSQNSSKESSRTASVILKPLENTTDIVMARSSIREYWNKMEEKSRGDSGADLQGRDRYPYTKSHKTHINKTNNTSAEKQSLHHSKTELRKQAVTKADSASPSKADTWGVCRWLFWALFLLASLALGLMVYRHFASSSIEAEHQKRLLYSTNFDARFAELMPLFPSQRPELWKRTEIHLKRHLSLTDPTEPVSLLLTSGQGAEKTLGCLAQKLAMAFSSALNSSVLGIDGVSKSAQDSDQVKLHIDKALTEAFEGGTRAAVIHRFEELPPGSTLIFYRYCDHENAAFKKVFLAFTVMLPVPELDFKLSLNAVEEQVQHYLKEKFISTDKTAEFNKMDIDKLSGLWSRISHLILPVTAEMKIEQHGCEE